MYYYNVVVDSNVGKFLVYRSEQDLKSGIRVIIQLKNKYITGIIWDKVKTKPDFISKPVIEVVDYKPKINKELLTLAEWMSKYYHSTFTSILKLFIPTAAQVHFQKKIRLVEKATINDFNGDAVKLYEVLANRCWIDIDIVKKNIPIKNFYSIIEFYENEEIVEIERILDTKIKKKFENHVFLQSSNLNGVKLTSKQKKLYEKILIKKDIKLSIIAKEFSYSIVKNLKEKGLVKVEAIEVKPKKRNIAISITNRSISLNEEQKDVFKNILYSINKNVFQAFLLYGITGSGKTEIYIKLIEETLKNGKTALMLVPEISLTPQMEKRFFETFGDKVGLIHSHLNERERWDEWKKILNGKSKVVIGVRSAIFAPLINLGLIIIDEEHETSYKQSKSPHYNARDLAIVRAKNNNAVVLLGSATPSMESWNNAINGKYKLLKLTKRNGKQILPNVEIIDMRMEKSKYKIFSERMLEQINQRLERKEQIIIFQNRRGYSSYVQCTDCGELLECPNCNISLNLHKSNNSAECHYCGYKMDMPRKCPVCGGYNFKLGSPGTEQIEIKLGQLFPNAKILRMDSDTATKKNSYDKMFHEMNIGAIDILVGTQMIAKGLNFLNVTFVGVISAESILNIPDFRAAERTFQLLTQVAGRSGRGKKAGEVLIQTFNPENYAIENSKNQDFEKFAKLELELRKMLKYPPFDRLSRIIYEHEDEVKLKEMKKYIDAKTMDFKRKNKKLRVIFLGPIEAPIPKINTKIRYHMIIKTKTYAEMAKVLDWYESNIKISNSIKASIDVDPLSLL
jgi:primosomal protein N' (replication factor Y)